jgi:putrescine transport system permease protein
MNGLGFLAAHGLPGAERMSAGNALTRSAPWRGTAWAMGKLGISGRTLVIAIPMLWLLVFFLAPFFVLGRISLAEAIIARPPYTPLFERNRMAA